MFNGLNNQLNNIVNAQLQAQQQQAALQAQQDMIDAERSAIRNKYDVFAFSALEKEVEDLFYAFTKNIHTLNDSAPQSITSKAQPQALMQSIFASRDSHSKHIDDIQKAIQSAPSLSQADQSWHILNVRHKEFKDSWAKNTSDFNKQYKDAIAKLQGGVGDQGDNIPPADQNQNQNLQQQLENALKQMEEMQAAYAQLQQQLADKDGVIQNLQTTLSNTQARLIDKTEEASENHTKYLEEKHKAELISVKAKSFSDKLNTFINNHQEIEDQEELVNISGGLGQLADNYEA